MKDRITQLEIAMSAQNLPINHADKLLALVTRYEAIFQRLVILQTEIGINYKSGLYGSLRTAAHKIEVLAKEAEQYEILVHMLMLRRNEKYFMLRRDEK
jgi:methyl-accepting chemotaxis protein